MFDWAHKKVVLAKAAIGWIAITAWLVATSYCGLSAFHKDSDLSHQDGAKAAVSQDSECHHSDCHSHKKTSDQPKPSNSACCKDLQIVVVSTAHDIQVFPQFSAFWGPSEIDLLNEHNAGFYKSLFAYGHGPPGTSVILFCLRHSHQENAPPSV